MATEYTNMQAYIYPTSSGEIHYWLHKSDSVTPTLVFLPGLTADHRLFDKQVEYFAARCSVLVWDAPGHGASRPFTLNFSLMQEASWLHEILVHEHITRPILVGQSMGGYVAQAFMEQFPNEVAGFIAIDSAPLLRKYVTTAEIWMLRHVEGFYRIYPWQALMRHGARGCAETDYGRQLTQDMMNQYTHDEYCALAGHGYRILASAMDADLPYIVPCSALLICGTKDKAASTKRYNKQWAKELPIYWVPNAGHNSNTDNSEAVNAQIEQFVHALP